MMIRPYKLSIMPAGTFGTGYTEGSLQVTNKLRGSIIMSHHLTWPEICQHAALCLIDYGEIY